MRVVLNGANIVTKEELHRQIKEQMQLPDWYGNNLDALHDVLTECEEPTVIEILNKEKLSEQLKEYGVSLLRVFSDAEQENERITIQIQQKEEKRMSTPHNEAKQGKIAKVVLMPGDPLRAKFIAENWLTEVRQINTVRNMFAYTGVYKDTEVTVMGSGMGMPSIGIYSYELFDVYGVEAIIRVGSAGAYTEHLNLFDVVLASECFSETTFAKVQNGTEAKRMYPSKELNAVIMEAANTVKVPVRETCIHSSDVFYAESNVDSYEVIFQKHGCECVEMESYALFHNANVLHKKAACLLTISDCFPSGAKATPKERQNAFTNMMEVALEAARNITK